MAKLKKKTPSYLVVDADKPIFIMITPRDIELAIKDDPRRCAVAMACQRQVKAEEVRVHKTKAYVRKGNRWVRYIVPEAVYRELVAFDRGATFEPGTYVLRAPTPSERLGAPHSQARTGNSQHHRTPPIVMKTKNMRPDGPHALYKEIE